MGDLAGKIGAEYKDNKLVPHETKTQLEEGRKVVITTGSHNKVVRDAHITL